MCGRPKIEQPKIQRIAAPSSDAAQREGDYERVMRRSRNGVAADILTSPLGLVGRMMEG